MKAGQNIHFVLGDDETLYHKVENLAALRILNVNVGIRDEALLATMQVKPSLLDRIKEAQTVAET